MKTIKKQVEFTTKVYTNLEKLIYFANKRTNLLKQIDKIDKRIEELKKLKPDDYQE